MSGRDDDDVLGLGLGLWVRLWVRLEGGGTSDGKKARISSRPAPIDISDDSSGSGISSPRKASRSSTS
ncbi:hypothetical protein A0O28_0099680 [Trichoderma guizhouense]|uniref:Uncharacterized protein n=1 Tax=Trichoderma guizhouense TaxID=1491466 RepID=A0A1T3CRF6_9HYPO|nr:hypothetical protein A0O28_0099680 [Trichoderma guizhouense]